MASMLERRLQSGQFADETPTLTTRMIEHYRSALASNPDEPAHRYNLAAALHVAGRSTEALEILSQGICSVPSDARLHYGIACVQQSLGQYRIAENAFQKATDLEPDFSDAWYGLGSIYQHCGNTKSAATCYAKALELVPDHAIARHLLDSLTGNTTDQPDAFFVEQLFDHYASRYDEHLLNELHYQGHTLVASALGNKLDHHEQNRVLDLGCGTGLFGGEIRSLCSHLVGIDLSSEMIKRAKGRGCYDELIVADLVQFLQQSPASNYDIVAAVDVFSYLGDLQPALDEIHRVLIPGGLLAFTVEAADDEYRLDNTGRYQHSKTYLDQQAKQHSYETLSMELTTLRSENRSACEAWLCLWHK